MPRQEPYRPQFHYSPARNWVNDPNGLVWFEGEYHLFYQYNPFGDQWGHMSWGHAVSPDLVNWRELPVAIAEDTDAAIFSGSVVVDHANSAGFGAAGETPLVAVYTRSKNRPEGGQSQALSYSLDRGRSWVAYGGNPVLDIGLRDFRDPKVFWHAPSAQWVMAVVVPDARCAQFYGSGNLKNWQLLSEFSAPFEGEGIWECPDLIPLWPVGEAARADELAAEAQPVWVFKVDVFGGHPSGGTGARLFYGHFDGRQFHAEPELAPRWADAGADFYAALSWANLPHVQARGQAPGQALGQAHGPAIWLAWMNCHRYAKHLPTQPWRGNFTVPRSLSVRRHLGEWQLLQQPHAALQRLREPLLEQHSLHLADMRVQPGAVRGRLPDALPGQGTLLPEGSDGRTLELELVINQTEADECGLLLRVGAGEVESAGGASGSGIDSACAVGYDARRGMVFVDRSRAGWQVPGDALFGQRRECRCAPPRNGEPLRLRILLDWASVEVFVGDGEQVLSEQIFPAQAHQGLRLYSLGGVTQVDVLRVWHLAAARFES